MKRQAVKGESRRATTAKQRKFRVLSQGTPAMVRGIADAVVIKDENIFFLCERNGNVPEDAGHGLGLYFNDCRYLSMYTLTIRRSPLFSLAASALDGNRALFQLANRELSGGESGPIRTHELSVRWERILDGKENTLRDKLTFVNLGSTRVRCAIDLRFRSEFEDVYAVREFLPRRPDKSRPLLRWKNRTLTLSRKGADNVTRSLAITLEGTKPFRMARASAAFAMRLAPGAQQEITIDLQVSERGAVTQERSNNVPARRAPRELLNDVSVAGFQYYCEVESDSYSLNRTLARSRSDLRMLRSHVNRDYYFAAGIPWFATLFGRDSLITSLQTLAYAPQIAEQTLRLLAKYQASQADDWRDAQPGKILHELRVGEFARTGEIPHTPYYGTVDAPALSHPDRPARSVDRRPHAVSRSSA
jgi:glycogen debranching enzyme